MRWAVLTAHPRAAHYVYWEGAPGTWLTIRID